MLGSPLVLLTRQSKLGSMTLNDVSQTFVNSIARGMISYMTRPCSPATLGSEAVPHLPSMRYGTEVKSAVVDRNTTRRFPESMSVPRVGQSLAASDADVGAYASVSSPAALKTVSYSEGATLSELTIRRETTVDNEIIS